MARIKRRGLDYFPMNTDFIHDRAVRRLMKREGDSALGILVEVLSYIYAGEGYYVLADRLFYEDLSASLYEKDAADVERIIRLAVEYDLFDAALFAEHHILTSAEIQRQYLFSTRRRNASHLEASYCLIGNDESVETEPKPAECQPKSVKCLPEPMEDNLKSTECEVKPVGYELKTTDNKKTTEKRQKTADNKKSVDNNAYNTPKSANYSLEHSVNQLITNANGSLSSGEHVYANTRSTGINVTLIPENVTSGTHSIAQNSIAQHSIAQKSKEKPLLNPPLKKTGEEAVKEEGTEEEFSGISRKRMEWTQEAVNSLLPPSDGTPRNFSGLLDSLRSYGIPPSEQYAIIRKSNFGAIGGTVWKGLSTLRGCNGKIKLPGRYLLSVVNKQPDRMS